MLTLGYEATVAAGPKVTAVNARHSEQVTRAWGPTAAAAVVACLPPAAMATGLGCAGLGLALDNSAVAASGAVAATMGIVAQRSASRRLRRRLRQERARNRLELHDLEIRLEQATRHLAEAVALAEAATRAMSGAPLVLTPDGAVVASAAGAPAPASEPVTVAPEPAVPLPAAPDPAAEEREQPLPALPRRVAVRGAVSAHLADAARANADIAGRVAARLADPAAVFGQPVVPATPADLVAPTNGFALGPVADVEDVGWFSPVRPAGGGLPPAPPSPAVGIAVATAAARPGRLVAAGAPSGLPAGGGLPPGPREPASGPIALAGTSPHAPQLPPRLAEAKVVDLSLLAHPAEPALIVVRRGRHAAPADHVA